MIGKYTRLHCCNNEQELIVKNARPSICCTNSPTKYDYVPLPESIRARAALCTGYIRPGLPSSDCAIYVGNSAGDGTGSGSGGGGEGTDISPVNLQGSQQNPGQNPVLVRTRPSSEMTA